MEAILIVVLICAFVFFIYTFHNMSKKNTKKDDKQNSKTADSKPESKSKTDDIPNILKEVTSGNYMYDLSRASNNEVQFVENESISLEGQESIKRTNVEKAFDDIGDIGDDLDELIDIEIEEIEEIEDDLNDEIGQSFDDSMILGDVAGDETNKTENDISKEYKKLSKNMKAIIISNALDKKYNK